MARILVVDDNDENRYLLEVLLKGMGHQVDTAKNGAEALRLALSHPPQLVVSDILMPGMDGFAFCLEWRKSERLRKIPFIIYTATYTEPQDEELAYNLGADRFVLKPQDPEALAGIVKDALEGRFGEKRGPGTLPAKEETAVLKDYSEALFRKLEQKLADLEASREAQRESETKYRIVADNTWSWEFWLGPRGDFLYCSPSCLRVTGRGREEFLADPALLPRIVHPEDLPRFLAHRDEAERSIGKGTLEFRILHADGTVRWIAHDCIPVRGEDGGFLGTRGSNRDITENRRLEELLRHAQRMETAGLMAGGIAREFNQLMAAITGSLDHIPRQAGREDPLRESLDQILAATARASSLTRSLLAFSRRQKMVFAPLDLNHLVRDQEERVRKMAGDRTGLSLDLGKGPFTVDADRVQMEQVLMNLAANARDSIPPGGCITLSTGTLEVDASFVERHGMGTPGSYAVLAVSDNGVGMSGEALDRVFEPFFNAKGEGTETGLGLPVAYGIVRQHGGFILVESEPGKGATFKVALPLH